MRARRRLLLPRFNREVVMTLKLLLAALGTVAMLSTAIAQVQPTPPTKGGPRSARSIECSKQADAKGLHGKERRKFRRQCLRGRTPV